MAGTLILFCCASLRRCSSMSSCARICKVENGRGFGLAPSALRVSLEMYDASLISMLSIVSLSWDNGLVKEYIVIVSWDNNKSSEQ
jgi:hypothetical protein